MIFHENRLLADDSCEISYLIFVESPNLSSAAVVIGALRVKTYSRVEIYRDIHCLIFLICAIKVPNVCGSEMKSQITFQTLQIQPRRISVPPHPDLHCT